MRAQFMLSKGGKEKRDGLSHDEREAAELEQIAHDEQEDVKHLLALEIGRASCRERVS